ncbi:MAG: TonB-dependent receptor domain-containing protein [Novosphingobium sp.]
MKSTLKLTVGASIMALTVATGAWAQEATPAEGAEANASDIVVTGSRVISNGANSPTPLTTISAETLLATTPASVPDALNKLPVFQGSTQPRSAGGSQVMAGQNIINLRNLGPQRALILLDGHRVTPTNPDGTVSIDILPLDLMNKVDVVTGGASAVYGSDAVSGVVNFVLDKKFSGLKADVNGGISTYGDGASYRVSLVAGTDLFDGRGHVEFAGSHYERNLVNMVDRPYGSQFWVQTGNGNANNPFVMTPNATRPSAPYGGRISCGGCAIDGYQFLSGSAVTPFNVGTTTGTGNVSSGGDGGQGKYGTALNELRTTALFGRFSYDVGPGATFYVQGSYARQSALGWWFPIKIGPGSTGTMFKNNPYLSQTIRTQLGDNGTNTAGNLFSIGEFVDLGTTGNAGTRGLNETYSVSAGLDGSVGRFNWSVYYTHGTTHQTLESLNNQNFQKLFASLDAVNTPNGIKCYAATQAATAAAYANCVPINPFGAGSVTRDALNWITETTFYRATNTLDNLGASIAGTLVDGWAGPIKGALSAEIRWNKLGIESNALPNATVNCAGQRTEICKDTQLLWAGGVMPMQASNNVWEVAGELGVPLIKDSPFAQELTLNLAGRYTKYSTSGSVGTWKVGLDYHVNDWLRFRGTVSSDIRAPSLYELFQPLTVQNAGFFDLHTNQQVNVPQFTGGNPNLVPEKARTYTAGIVLTPLPGLTASVDFYSVKINNAISQISGVDVVTQRLCENSGGNSIYCTLYKRPLPFSDTSLGNRPDEVYSLWLNSSLRQIKGWDFEVNYAFEWHGRWNARVLANYQPVNRQQLLPGAPITTPGAPPVNSLIAKTHITGYLTYESNGWTVGLQNRWHSRIDKRVTEDASIPQNYVDPYVSSANYLDISIQKELDIGGTKVIPYLNVQNLFNAKGEVYSNSAVQGIYYPVSQDDDVMGRYFTIGVRVRM